MMKLFLLWALLLLPVGPAAAQEIKMSQTAPLEQVYGETVEDDALLPMNELDMPSMRQPLMWNSRFPH